MKTNFNHKAYSHRPQVKTAISMTKRNLGATLGGKTHFPRMRDLYLHGLTHNIAIALLWLFYRAATSPLVDSSRITEKSYVPFSRFVPFSQFEWRMPTASCSNGA
jgi:hypothetical protein